MDHSVAAADALRAADSWLAQAQETAGQAAASVRESTVKEVVKAAHDTAEVEAKAAAAKLEKDMKAAIPDAKKAAMKPWEDVMARAAVPGARGGGQGAELHARRAQPPRAGEGHDGLRERDVLPGREHRRDAPGVHGNNRAGGVPCRGDAEPRCSAAPSADHLARALARLGHVTLCAHERSPPVLGG